VLAVRVAVQAELVAQHVDEPGLDQHGRPGAGPLALDLADDPLPRLREREVVRALGGQVGRLGGLDPVDPERPLAALGAGDQVPDVVLVDESPRVHQALCALLGTGRHVGQPDLAPGDHGCLQRVHEPWSVPVAPAPAGRIDHRRVGRRLRVGPERRGQRPDELAQRRLRVRGHRRGRPRQQEQRPRLRCGQAAEIGTGAADQRPPAAAPGLRVDRDAGAGQRLQVAARGGHRHLQFGGQLGRGDPAAGLDEQESGDEAIGAHGFFLPEKVLS
jgi:hypothetical protein